jgi:hypothetical protein
MRTKPSLLGTIAVLLVGLAAASASALSSERWTNNTPYGVFFNDYDPNFYTGFVPRVQERDGSRFTSDAAISCACVWCCPTKRSLRQLPPRPGGAARISTKVIDAEVIKLTTNTAWETYDQRFKRRRHCRARGEARNGFTREWRELNLRMIGKLSPIGCSTFRKTSIRWSMRMRRALKASDPATTLEAKLDLVNAFFPHRIVLDRLTPERDAALAELIRLAKADQQAEFRRRRRPLLRRHHRQYLRRARRQARLL